MLHTAHSMNDMNMTVQMDTAELKIKCLKFVDASTVAAVWQRRKFNLRAIFEFSICTVRPLHFYALYKYTFQISYSCQKKLNICEYISLGNISVDH